MRHKRDNRIWSIAPRMTACISLDAPWAAVGVYRQWIRVAQCIISVSVLCIPSFLLRFLQQTTMLALWQQVSLSISFYEQHQKLLNSSRAQFFNIQQVFFYQFNSYSEIKISSGRRNNNTGWWKGIGLRRAENKSQFKTCWFLPHHLLDHLVLDHLVLDHRPLDHHLVDHHLYVSEDDSLIAHVCPWADYVYFQ